MGAAEAGSAWQPAAVPFSANRPEVGSRPASPRPAGTLRPSVEVGEILIRMTGCSPAKKRCSWRAALSHSRLAAGENSTHLGLATRSFPAPDPVKTRRSSRSTARPVPDQYFTDLHAWTEVYLPGAAGLAWTPPQVCRGRRAPAAGCHAGASLRGAHFGKVDECEVSFAHQMSVRRVHEDPRVTLPYTEEQWERILSLGCQVDREIRDGDIRLTMGGEPTFVSIDDMEGAEWNAAAQGPKSGYWRGRCWTAFVTGLPRRIAPPRARQWYPGEPLRAGPSHAIGGPMARRCGGIVNCWPARRWTTSLAVP